MGKSDMEKKTPAKPGIKIWCPECGRPLHYIDRMPLETILIESKCKRCNAVTSVPLYRQKGF